MSNYSESTLAIPAIIALGKNNGEMSTSDLITELVHVFKPDGKDLEILDNRTDSHFSQKVRNLKAHNTLGKLCYAQTTDDGWKLTEEGSAFYERICGILTAHTKPLSMYSLPLQKIFYGTPGSGKSHKVKDNVLKGIDEEYIFRTTFHPDSDYASFVGCYKPKMDAGEIVYRFAPQAFTKAYIKAWENKGKQVYLVIEEINRGNCAQIFGDLFQLLDRKGGVSEYPINADADLQQYLEGELGNDNEGIKNGQLCLPANFNIVATMNTSDQSLFPMDSAFKRRWSWECVPVDYNDTESGTFSITIGSATYNWLEFLKVVNEKIKKATDSEDKQMGNFFISGNIDEREFIDKVMFYLWNDICKDEMGTQNNFFRYYSNTENTETEEFSFNELFGNDNTEILTKFMEYLDVKNE